MTTRPVVSRPWLRLLRRVAVGVTGSVVVLVGLVLVPLPGPGWAIVFAGVALLGTEFPWAERLVLAVRRRLRLVSARLSRLPRRVLVVSVIAGGLAVLVGLTVGAVLLVR